MENNNKRIKTYNKQYDHDLRSKGETIEDFAKK